jgi:hypothetical protein
MLEENKSLMHTEWVSSLQQETVRPQRGILKQKLFPRLACKPALLFFKNELCPAVFKV